MITGKSKNYRSSGKLKVRLQIVCFSMEFHSNALGVQQSRVSHASANSSVDDRMVVVGDCSWQLIFGL